MPVALLLIADSGMQIPGEDQHKTEDDGCNRFSMDTTGVGQYNLSLLESFQRQFLDTGRPGLQPPERRIRTQQCVTDAFAPADYDFRLGEHLQIRFFGISQCKGITWGGGEDGFLLPGRKGL
ncbi:hypothetical protein D3C81_1304540 [compost metagenome]